MPHVMKLYICPLFYIMQLEIIHHKQTIITSTERIEHFWPPVFLAMLHVCWQQRHVLFGFFDLQTCQSLPMFLEC
jgi:hypothetical protein